MLINLLPKAEEVLDLLHCGRSEISMNTIKPAIEGLHISAGLVGNRVHLLIRNKIALCIEWMLQRGIARMKFFTPLETWFIYQLRILHYQLVMHINYYPSSLGPSNIGGKP